MYVLKAAVSGWADMRMNKVGSQSISGSSDTLVTNWAADGGYPDTDIVTNANKLTVRSSGGVAKTVTAVVTWTGSSGFNKSCKIFKNGAQIGSTQTSISASGTFNFSIPGITFNEGDTLELRGTLPGGGSLSVTATNTHILVS